MSTKDEAPELSRNSNAMDAELTVTYYDMLVGLKASCGLEIKGISNHAHNRFIERSITKERALDIILNAQIIYPGNTPGTICQQKDGLRIVINENTGNIITAVDLEENE